MRDGLVLQAHFVPFSAVKGTYIGLAMADPATVETVGLVKLTLSAQGVATGSLIIGGKTLVLDKGSFANNGRRSGRFSLRGQSSLPVALQLRAVPGEEGITGTLTGGQITVALSTERAGYSSRNRAPQAGNYTANLLRPLEPASRFGHGYGTVKVSHIGNVRFVGVLGDGTKVSQSATLSHAGLWPFFTLFEKGRGVAAGELKFRSQEGISDIDGTVAWVLAAQTGFQLEFRGSRYSASALPTQATMTLAGGGLAARLGSLSLTFDSRGRLLPFTGLEAVKMKFITSQGLFKGTFLPPGASKALPFAGVYRPTDSSGAGLFQNSDNSAGTVELDSP